jgi:hypothetical protein
MRMPWLNGWPPSGARISNGGGKADSRGGTGRMMGTDSPTQGCYSHPGPSWPKACPTHI